MCNCQPVMLPPQCCVNNYYTTRMVPYIQPIVHINRENIVNVPQYFQVPITRNMVVDPGCPGRGSGCPRRRS